MDGGEEHHQRFELSPLLVGLIGIFSGAIVILTFHFILMSCNRRNRTLTSTNQIDSTRFPNRTPSNTSSTTSTSHLITVYRSGISNDGKHQQQQQQQDQLFECVICLSEILDGEEVLVMPECGHTFHVPCIDAWLCRHTNCPICRAHVIIHPRSERDDVIVYVPVTR